MCLHALYQSAGCVESRNIIICDFRDFEYFVNFQSQDWVNPLNADLNPIRHLLALVGARHIVHVSTIRVKSSKNRH
jgi:hypothetical protein